MRDLWQWIEGDMGRGVFTPEGIILSLLLAFVLGQVLAWVYYATHAGLSYSRSFVQSLILITVVVAMVMAVIGNSLITAFGLMGALALVRFRNVVKDTRDIAFVFCALVVGMAAGAQRFAVAIGGTVLLSLIAVYLHLTSFGAHQSHNGFLRFRLVGGVVGPGHPILGILKRFCQTYTLIAVQDASFSGAAEYSYQIMMRDCSRNEEMLLDLERVPGIDNVNLTLQENLLEV